MASIAHHINRKLDNFTACWKRTEILVNRGQMRSTVVELGSHNSIFMVPLSQNFAESKTVMKILLDPYHQHELRHDEILMTSSTL